MKRLPAARRLCAVASLLYSALSAGFANAADAPALRYPARPVRIIVPLAPGGGTDNLTRIIAPGLSGLLGQQFIVENRAGAATQIGTEFVARAAPDGYTLLHVDTSFTSNPSLYAKLPYDSLRDFAPVSLLASAPVVLIIHPSVPAKSLSELLVLAKLTPAQFNFAVGGYGTATHLGVEQFRQATHIDLVIVPFKGGGLATGSVLSGHVTMMFAGPSSITQHIAAGRLRAIAVTGEKRNRALPLVPTFVEAGLAGINSGSYWGALAPAATPVDIVEKLSIAMEKVLQVDHVRQRLFDMGYEPIGSTPAQFGVNLRAEMAKWAKIVSDARINVQ